MAHFPILQSGVRNAARDEASIAEAALLARVASRDQNAFETLYRAYRPRLRQFLMRMTRQPALSEDVLEETMLVVWQKARTFDNGSKPSTWIFAIAWRQALKALRKQREPVEAVDPDTLRSNASGPEGEMHRRQMGERLRAALAGLSAEHRAVIELTYYQGRACREIAEIMQCPVDTVKTRMFYARRRLKALLLFTQEDLP
ncbi:MAG: sigma-70 family RNA polymerase sigma factor [Proteobacteria bacterium]|nr:sigma-70 family RNA polymerase sigma factor [Pseudomonadota bacterium]